MTTEYLYKIIRVVRFPYTDIAFGHIIDENWQTLIRHPFAKITHKSYNGIYYYLKSASILTHNFTVSACGIKIIDNDKTMKSMTFNTNPWFKNKINSTKYEGKRRSYSQFAQWHAASVCAETRTWELHKDYVKSPNKKKKKKSKKKKMDTTPCAKNIYKLLKLNEQNDKEKDDSNKQSQSQSQSNDDSDNDKNQNQQSQSKAADGKKFKLPHGWPVLVPKLNLNKYEQWLQDKSNSEEKQHTLEILAKKTEAERNYLRMRDFESDLMGKCDLASRQHIFGYNPDDLQTADWDWITPKCTDWKQGDNQLDETTNDDIIDGLLTRWWTIALTYVSSTVENNSDIKQLGLRCFLDWKKLYNDLWKIHDTNPETINKLLSENSGLAFTMQAVKFARHENADYHSSVFTKRDYWVSMIVGSFNHKDVDAQMVLLEKVIAKNVADTNWYVKKLKDDKELNNLWYFHMIEYHDEKYQKSETYKESFHEYFLLPDNWAEIYKSGEQFKDHSNNPPSNKRKNNPEEAFDEPLRKRRRKNHAVSPERVKRAAKMIVSNKVKSLDFTIYDELVEKMQVQVNQIVEEQMAEIFADVDIQTQRRALRFYKKYHDSNGNLIRKELSQMSWSQSPQPPTMNNPTNKNKTKDNSNK